MRIAKQVLVKNSLLFDRISTQNRKVLHFVVFGDFHTDLPSS